MALVEAVWAEVSHVKVATLPSAITDPGAGENVPYGFSLILQLAGSVWKRGIIKCFNINLLSSNGLCPTIEYTPIQTYVLSKDLMKFIVKKFDPRQLIID